MYVLFGLTKRDDRKCDKWLLLSVVLSALESGLVAGQWKVERNTMILSYSLPSIFYKMSSCGIVKSFSNEVKRAKSSMPTGRMSLDADFDPNEQASLIT
jgi:hypothetical protein